MSLRLIWQRLNPSVAVRRLITVIALVSVGYIAGSIAPPPAVSFDIGTGNASAANRMADHASGAPFRSAPAMATEPFDYFPDHYRNRATHVAEQIDTF